MDNQNVNGNNSLLFTFILGIFSWITPERVDIGLKVLTALGAVIAAIMAARYHFYAAKKEKEQIKRLQRRRDDDDYLD